MGLVVYKCAFAIDEPALFGDWSVFTHWWLWGFTIKSFAAFSRQLPGVSRAMCNSISGCSNAASVKSNKCEHVHEFLV